MGTAWLGMALVNLLWAAASLLDPAFAREPYLPSPALVFMIHAGIGAAMLTRRLRFHALLGTAAATAYYSLLVKPFAPIAEPQTVGISAVSLSMALSRFEETRYVVFLRNFLLRAGIAYPLFEWGVDAYRNPLHFTSYIMGNSVARTLVSPVGVENAVFLLFAAEVVLSLLLVSGFGAKAVGLLTAGFLSFLSAVALYPLALPQNIALITAAIDYSQKQA
ncbi:MAG: hypothetical protein QXV86_05060 [Candidatus Caldarchaeum sp.]